MRKPIDKQLPKYRDIISKINYLRKLLLVYRILHHEDIIEEVNLNIDGRAFELTSPQIFLFNSETLASGEEKPALKEVLKMLSKFLQKKGELTKNTLEGLVHEALEKELFPTLTPTNIIDVSGKSIMTYTIPHREIIDKVIQLADGIPSTNQKDQAFYSTGYSRITHKRILKIYRERFSGEPNTVGRGEEKERAITFYKELVEKVGKTLEIISEIRIIEESNEGGQDGESHMKTGKSHFRPQENTPFHAQNEEMGTEGWKYSNFGDITQENNTRTSDMGISPRGKRRVMDKK